MGSPYTDDYRNASVVHDVACDDPEVDRKEADRMFYFACLAGGCSMKQASWLYVGVRLGAWGANVMGWAPFARGELLYRFPDEKSDNERELLKKYAEIMPKVTALGDSFSFDELDQLVEAELAK